MKDLEFLRAVRKQVANGVGIYLAPVALPDGKTGMRRERFCRLVDLAGPTQLVARALDATGKNLELIDRAIARVKENGESPDDD